MSSVCHNDTISSRSERSAAAVSSGVGEWNEGVERVGDASQLGEQCAALGFGGMRGEDRLHEQAGQQALQLFGRHALLPQLDEGRAHRLGHRRATRVFLVLTAVQHPHPLLLLGQIHELEVRGKRLHYAARVRQRQRAHLRQQAFSGSRVSGPVRFGQGPHVFDQRKQRRPFLLDDGLAEQIAQQVDLLAQRIAVGHGRSVRCPWPVMEVMTNSHAWWPSHPGER